jgi:hypothetical protein
MAGSKGRTADALLPGIPRGILTSGRQLASGGTLGGRKGPRPHHNAGCLSFEKRTRNLDWPIAAVAVICEISVTPVERARNGHKSSLSLLGAGPHHVQRHWPSNPYAWDDTMTATPTEKTSERTEAAGSTNSLDEYADAEQNFQPRSFKFWTIIIGMYLAMFLVALVSRQCVQFP